MRTVAITGMGAISACGIGVEALWTGARDGRSAVREVDFPRIERQSVKRAARILPEDYATLLPNARPRFQDRTAILGVAAARQAIAAAGLEAEHFGSRCGVVIGSGFGGAETLDGNYAKFFERVGRIEPLAIPKIMTSSAASWTAMDFGVTGPVFCISTACSSATQSIGIAADMIRAGVIDRCIAGGAEALLIDGVFSSWESLHVMTTTKCRPFSRDRNGMVLGEGAGVVVLEAADLARARGAEVLVELAGYASSCDAGDLLKPEPRGATDCMNAALAAAGLPPEAIGYVNAHGTGTAFNDKSESAAVLDVFAGRAAPIPMSSTKSQVGHALGAAGVIEAIATLAALESGILPPTLNFVEPDPECPVDAVTEGPRECAVDVAITNSFAFGGLNVSIVLGRGE